MKNVVLALSFTVTKLLIAQTATVTPDYVSDRGLSKAQITSMTSHFDASLFDNLATKNFAAISDERWSRWNQYQVLAAYGDKLQPDPVCGSFLSKYYSQKTIDEISATLVKAFMDSPYFLRKPASSMNSDGVVDGFLLSTRGDPTYDKMKALMANGGCSGRHVQDIIVGLAYLYKERASIEVTSAPPPPLPTASDVPEIPEIGADPMAWANSVNEIMSRLVNRRTYSEGSELVLSFAQSRAMRNLRGEQTWIDELKRVIERTRIYCSEPKGACVDLKLYEGILGREVQAMSVR